MGQAESKAHAVPHSYYIYQWVLLRSLCEDGQGNGVLHEGWQGVDREEVSVGGRRGGRGTQHTVQEVSIGREVWGRRSRLQCCSWLPFALNQAVNLVRLTAVNLVRLTYVNTSTARGAGLQL